jgi:hypothetical protein
VFRWHQFALPNHTSQPLHRRATGNPTKRDRPSSKTRLLDRHPSQKRQRRLVCKSSKAPYARRADCSRRLDQQRSRLNGSFQYSIQDNIAADVRVSTERRLKALESDLARALVARKERAIAVRYHKIKFFGACLLRCPLFGLIMLQSVRKSRVRSSSSKNNSQRHPKPMRALGRN